MSLMDRAFGKDRKRPPGGALGAIPQAGASMPWDEVMRLADLGGAQADKAPCGHAAVAFDGGTRGCPSPACPPPAEASDAGTAGTAERVRLFVLGDHMRYQSVDAARAGQALAFAVRDGRATVRLARRTLMALDLSREPSARAERAELVKELRRRPAGAAL